MTTAELQPVTVTAEELTPATVAAYRRTTDHPSFDASSDEGFCYVDCPYCGQIHKHKDELGKQCSQCTPGDVATHIDYVLDTAACTAPACKPVEDYNLRRLIALRKDKRARDHARLRAARIDNLTHESAITQYLYAALEDINARSDKPLQLHLPYTIDVINDEALPSPPPDVIATADPLLPGRNIVDCPFCGEKHMHSGLGHRLGSCGNKYNIVRIDIGPRRRIEPNGYSKVFGYEAGPRKIDYLCPYCETIHTTDRFDVVGTPCSRVENECRELTEAEINLVEHESFNESIHELEFGYKQPPDERNDDYKRLCEELQNSEDACYFTNYVEVVDPSVCKEEIIEVSGSSTPEEIFTKIAWALAESHYIRGDDLIHVDDDGRVTAVTADTLGGHLSEHATVYVKKGKLFEHDILPLKYCHGFFASNVWREIIPRIRYVGSVPCLDDNWEIVQPGWNDDAEVLYTGKRITPHRGRPDTVLELLADFAWADDIDKINYLGLLLDAFLYNRFSGCRPMALYWGTRTKVGKSTAAAIQHLVRDDVNDILTYPGNDDEMRKVIVGILQSGRRIITLDNVKASVISSPALEGLVTSPVYSGRPLYTNRIWTGPNNVLLQITVNLGELSTDLMSRSLPINMDFNGKNPMGRKFKHPNITKFVTDNIGQIRAELLGMIVNWIEKWKENGEPLYADPVPGCPSRFREWQGTIGGILEANNFKGFMHNMADTVQKADVGVQHLKQLIAAFYEQEEVCDDSRRRLTKHFLQFRQAAELCIQNPEWFANHLRGRAVQGVATKLGTVLKEYYGNTYEVDLLDGGRVVVRIEQANVNNRRGIWIEEVGFPGTVSGTPVDVP